MVVIAELETVETLVGVAVVVLLSGFVPLNEAPYLYTFKREPPPQYSVEFPEHVIPQSASGAESDALLSASPHQHSAPYSNPA